VEVETPTDYERPLDSESASSEKPSQAPPSHKSEKVPATRQQNQNHSCEFINGERPTNRDTQATIACTQENVDTTTATQTKKRKMATESDSTNEENVTDSDYSPLVGKCAMCKRSPLTRKEVDEHKTSKCASEECGADFSSEKQVDKHKNQSNIQIIKRVHPKIADQMYSLLVMQKLRPRVLHSPGPPATPRYRAS